MHRLRNIALALTLAASLGCGSTAPQACPGEPIGTFQFTGTRVSAQCTVDPPGGYASVAPETVAFTATLAYDPRTETATLCVPRRLSALFLGSRSADHVTVSATSDGAVLGGCAATCTATMGESIEGDLVRDGTGAATGFTGALVETMSAAGAAGACGACELPCEARYALTGTR